MFSRMTSSSVRMAAAMQGRAEFLAPETLMVPRRGLPPRTTNLSMAPVYGLSACKMGSCADTGLGSGESGFWAKRRFRAEADRAAGPPILSRDDMLLCGNADMATCWNSGYRGQVVLAKEVVERLL